MDYSKPRAMATLLDPFHASPGESTSYSHYTCRRKIIYAALNKMNDQSQKLKNV